MTWDDFPLFHDEQLMDPQTIDMSYSFKEGKSVRPLNHPRKGLQFKNFNPRELITYDYHLTFILNYKTTDDDFANESPHFQDAVEDFLSSVSLDYHDAMVTASINVYSDNHLLKGTYHYDAQQERFIFTSTQ